MKTQGKFIGISQLEDFGRLAQLVRAPALQAGGRRFKSRTAHHAIQSTPRAGRLLQRTVHRFETVIRTLGAETLRRMFGRRKLVLAGEALLRAGRLMSPNWFPINGERVLQQAVVKRCAAASGGALTAFDVGANVGDWNRALLAHCDRPASGTCTCTPSNRVTSALENQGAGGSQFHARVLHRCRK